MGLQTDGAVLKLPPYFYHHAPEMHLAFIAEDAEETLHLVTVDAAYFEVAIETACVDMAEHGVPVGNNVVFLGYVV